MADFTKKCPVCAENIAFDSDVCPKCGAKLAGGTRPNETIVAPLPVIPPGKGAPVDATVVTETLPLPHKERAPAGGTIIAEPGDIPRAPAALKTTTMVATPQQEQAIVSNLRTAPVRSTTFGKPPGGTSAPALQVESMEAPQSRPRSALILPVMAAVIVGLCLCFVGIAVYMKRDSLATILSKKNTPIPTSASTALIILPTPGPNLNITPTKILPARSPTPGVVVTITLWVIKPSDVMTRLTNDYQAQNPSIKVKVELITADGALNRWDQAVTGGNGPDLLLFSNSQLVEEVESSSVMPLDNLLQGKLDPYSRQAVEGVTVDGKIYGVPRAFYTVALYYDKTAVPEPPETLKDLQSLVTNGKRIVILQQPLYLYGFFTAFQGVLADASGKCIADQVGFSEGLQYLQDLKSSGAIFETDYKRANDTFRLGGVVMMVNSPDLLKDFTTTLGDKLEVATLPAGNVPAGALTQIDAFYINPKSPAVQAAVDLALYLTSSDAEQAWADEYLVPVRMDAQVDNLAVRAFREAAQLGVPWPQTSWFGNFWAPFTEKINAVFGGKLQPVEAITDACLQMNQANGK